uniref:Uncharacterized protein n=1 Tax=Arundo donax TaxID=35708 RepID=A0A0A9BNH8_ARUDO
MVIFFCVIITLAAWWAPCPFSLEKNNLAALQYWGPFSVVVENIKSDGT